MMTRANDRSPIYLYDLNLPALTALLAKWGEPTYRARQLWEWLYIHLTTDFDAMTNLPRTLRTRLAAETIIDRPQIVDTLRSTDGETRKDLLQLSDGETIEVVLMRYTRRRTACISTQVGCSIGCPFCATGQMGFRRNLRGGEIVAQVLHCAREWRAQGERLSNVVLMGMGEPLLNSEAVFAALRRMTDENGFRLGQRRITLSTVGIVPGIVRLAELAEQPHSGLQITLAISLHAATDALRNRLVPINRRYNLDTLFQACHHYIQRTGRRVSFEWALIAGVNDSAIQAQALAARLVGMQAHVNLIPLNPTDGYAGRPPAPADIGTFTAVLERHHIPYTIRLRRGVDIQASCGQLRQRSAAAGGGSSNNLSKPTTFKWVCFN